MNQNVQRSEGITSRFYSLKKSPTQGGYMEPALCTYVTGLLRSCQQYYKTPRTTRPHVYFSESVKFFLFADAEPFVCAHNVASRVPFWEYDERSRIEKLLASRVNTLVQATTMSWAVFHALASPIALQVVPKGNVESSV